MEKTSKFNKDSNSRTAVTGRVPGPHEQAAAQLYFERGSKQAIDKNHWRMTAFGSLTSTVVLSVALVMLFPLKTVETIQINKDQNGRVTVQNVDAQRFSADEDVKLSWANDWVTSLTEISNATWQRNVERAASKSVGTAIDQVRDYLGKADNQPAQILFEKPSYVREFNRLSLNSLSPDVVLVRYTLTSRPIPGSPKVVKGYAMTITLASIKPKSRDEVLNNPSGLAVQSFSISEEVVK